MPFGAVEPWPVVVTECQASMINGAVRDCSGRRTQRAEASGPATLLAFVPTASDDQATTPAVHRALCRVGPVPTRRRMHELDPTGPDCTGP
jgi:hypothetical protein